MLDVDRLVDKLCQTAGDHLLKQKTKGVINVSYSYNLIISAFISSMFTCLEIIIDHTSEMHPEFYKEAEKNLNNLKIDIKKSFDKQGAKFMNAQHVENKLND